MCCDADWKREVVQDHKWDFINVSEFHKTDFFTRLKYVWRYILLFKSLAVYGLDIFTAITMISTDRWTNTIAAKGSSGVVEVKFVIAKWVFVGCIIFSFLLLGYEWFKARQVIRSRDISYAFTNLLANDYFSFKNYDNFCLFCHIDESTKKKDDFAFFIFFTFKEWKRLLLADGPRQSINGLMLYSFGQANGWQTSNIPAYWDDSPITAMLLFSMIATVLIFAGSMILLIAAAIFYVPLLCYIQGNLKEYVCHKVDKRLSELIKKKQRVRAQKAAAMEKRLAKDGGLKNSKGEFVNVVMQPTLPKIRMDEDELTGKKGMSRSKSGDTLNVYSAPGSANGHEVYETYGGYPPSLDYSNGFYGNDNASSTTRLTDAAGPMGISYPPVVAPPPAAPSFPPPSAMRPISPGPNALYMSPPSAQPSMSRSNTQMTGFSSRSDQSYGRSDYSQRGLTPTSTNPPSSFNQPRSSPYDRTTPPMPLQPASAAMSPPPSLLPGQPSASSSLHLTRNNGNGSSNGVFRHNGEAVLSPSTYSTHSSNQILFPEPHTQASSSSSSASYARHQPAALRAGRERDSLGGLPYDGLDNDTDTDPGPAPSYYSGSPPRNRSGDGRGYRDEKAQWSRR